MIDYWQGRAGERTEGCILMASNVLPYAPTFKKYPGVSLKKNMYYPRSLLINFVLAKLGCAVNPRLAINSPCNRERMTFWHIGIGFLQGKSTGEVGFIAHMN